MFIKVIKPKKAIYYILCVIIAALIIYLAFLIFSNIRINKNQDGKKFVKNEEYVYVLYETKPRKNRKGGFLGDFRARLENIIQSVLPYDKKQNEGEQPEPVKQEENPAQKMPDDMFVPTFANVYRLTTMKELIENLYIIDKDAYVTLDDLNVNLLSAMDLKSDLEAREPKVLIFHTHSQEDFIDSREGVEEDTIVGIGQNLAEILVNDYNIPVVHDRGKYDTVNGRGGSYEVMEPYIRRILKKYPSIEVCIDLHRDGVNDDVRLVTEINGVERARIMYFNGITRLNDNGNPKELTELKNPYLKENLALSLQMQLKTNELYPGLTRKIYIRPYRYSLHFMPKSLLIEVGANTNTVQEMYNTMPLLAEILNQVLNEGSENLD